MEAGVLPQDTPISVQQLWQAIQASLSLLDQPQAALIALQLLTNGQEADVQFFAANMVLTVVKRHWSKIDMQSRDTIDGQIRGMIERGTAGQEAFSWLVLQRLILTSAYIATASGSEFMNAATNRVFHIAAKGEVLLALYMLAAIADSISNLHQRQRSRAVPSIPGHMDKVFQLVTFSLKQSAGDLSVSKAGLTCLKSWLMLSASEAAEMLMSPGSLQATQEELFALLLRVLASSDEDLADLGTDILVFLIGNAAFEDNSELEMKAVRAISAAIVAQKPTDPSHDAYLHSAAQIAASIANWDLHSIAGKMPEAVPLAALLLECLGCAHQGAVEQAVEFFDLLNAVPIEQRNPQLGQPIYASMLPYLSQQACYPQPPDNWEATSVEDEDALHSLRDHILSDALETCQNLLGDSYLEHFAEALSKAETWQKAEASLFALRFYKSRRPMGCPGTESLSRLFEFLFSPHFAAKLSNDHSRNALLQLVAAHSDWIAQSQERVLEGSISLALQSLDSLQCLASAASALLAICRDTQQDRALQLFKALQPSLQHQLVSSAGNREELVAAHTKAVHALVFLLEAADLSPSEACDLAVQLGLPFIQTAAQLTHSNEADFRAIQTAARLSALFGSVVDKLELIAFDDAQERHPAVHLVSSSTTCIQKIAGSIAVRRDQSIAAAFSKALRCCVRAVGSTGEGAILSLIGHVDALFPCDPAGSLQVMTTAVTFLNTGMTSLAEKLGTTLCLAAEGFARQLQDKARLDPDLVMAWFTLLSQFPVSFQASWVSEVEKVVIQNFGFARALLGRKEEDLLRSTIAFLRSALGLEAISRDETSKQCMASEGQQLVESVLLAIAISCPSRIVGLLSNLLFAMLNHRLFGDAVRGCFQSCMQNNCNLGQCLEEADRQKICDLALSANPKMSNVFVALMKDMSGIARGEMDSDVLLSYQL